MRRSKRAAVEAWLALIVASALFAAPAHATFPGENGKIAFVHLNTADGTTGVMTVDPDGGNLSPLTQVTDSLPVWSPDGSKIAFGRQTYYSHTAVVSDVLVMNADGSGLANLTNNGDAAFPAWSPDGSKLAFSSDPAHYECPCPEMNLYVINRDGTGLSQITPTDNGIYEYFPEWSPDSTKIAFVSSAGGIYTINPDGSDMTLIATEADRPGPVSWSPDGRKLAFAVPGGTQAFSPFAGYPFNAGDVVVMNADGSGRTTITSGPDHDGSPAWSPDGTKLAFSRAPAGADFCAVDAPCSNIYTINADGSGLSGVTSLSGADEYAPDWQPIPNGEPDCSGVVATPGNLRWPDNDFRTVMLSGATDPEHKRVKITIDGVTQDEPVGRSPDARLTRKPNNVKLRAERDKRRDGRVYTITFTASDGEGGECSGEATVEVQRYKSKPAVDSAPPSYDSFGS